MPRALFDKQAPSQFDLLRGNVEALSVHPKFTLPEAPQQAGLFLPQPLPQGASAGCCWARGVHVLRGAELCLGPCQAGRYSSVVQLSPTPCVRPCSASGLTPAVSRAAVLWQRRGPCAGFGPWTHSCCLLSFSTCGYREEGGERGRQSLWSCRHLPPPPQPCGLAAQGGQCCCGRRSPSLQLSRPGPSEAEGQR